jgi:hypothetical protein
MKVRSEIMTMWDHRRATLQFLGFALSSSLSQKTSFGPGVLSLSAGMDSSIGGVSEDIASSAVLEETMCPLSCHIDNSQTGKTRWKQMQGKRLSVALDVGMDRSMF